MSKSRLDKNIDIPDNILKKLLTPSELRMLKNRWQIVQLLEKGLTIRKIAETAKVGTDTVVRVAKMLEKVSFRKALGQQKRVNRKIKTKTPWIFGKSE